MSAYRVLGIDSSGREVRLSPVAADSWAVVCDVLGFTPVITQGGHLQRAASASATTHAGDAIDLRTWNLTRAQREAVIRVLRAHGWAAWFRDWSDPHIHAVPGRWAHPSPSALRQWDACHNGRDGLVGNGPDPHDYPLATKPPEDDMASAADEIMAHIDKRFADFERTFKRRTDTNRRVLRELINKGRVELSDVAELLADEDAEGN